MVSLLTQDVNREQGQLYRCSQYQVRSRRLLRAEFSPHTRRPPMASVRQRAQGSRRNRTSRETAPYAHIQHMPVIGRVTVLTNGVRVAIRPLGAPCDLAESHVAGAKLLTDFLSCFRGGLRLTRIVRYAIIPLSHNHYIYMP